MKVGGHHRPVAFLPSSVPDVQLDGPACDLDLSYLKINDGDGFRLMLQKLSLQILPEERGLANSTLSNHDDLELRLIALSKVLFLQHPIIHALPFPPYYNPSLHTHTTPHYTPIQHHSTAIVIRLCKMEESPSINPAQLFQKLSRESYFSCSKQSTNMGSVMRDINSVVLFWAAM